MKKIIHTSFLILMLLAVFLPVTNAQVSSDIRVSTPKINNVTGSKILLPGANTQSNQGQILQSQFLPNLTKFVIGLTGALSLLFVIVGAIQMLTAFGDDDGLGKGKKTITWALVGVVISLLSYAIVQVVSSINLGLPPKTAPTTTQTPKTP